MTNLNTNISTKTIIIAMVVILILSFAVILSQKKASIVNSKPSVISVAVNLTPKPLPSSSVISSPLPEPPKIRYVSGVVKKVNKASIIVSDAAAGKEIEVAFDKTTKILTGENAGREAAISDLAVDWNVAVFLPEDKNSNIAQIIQLVEKNTIK